MPTINICGGVEKNFFIITNYLSSKLKKITVITLSKFVKQRLNKRIKVVCPNFSFFENFGKRIKFLISLIFLFKEIKKIKSNCFMFSRYYILYFVMQNNKNKYYY